MKNLSAYIRDETRLTTRLLGALATTMSDALYPLASLSQIKSTPSSEDGIPADLETTSVLMAVSSSRKRASCSNSSFYRDHAV